MPNEFTVHRLNAAGLAKADQIACVFEQALAQLKALYIPTVDPGQIPCTSFAAREQALVVTKLQEACFFAKRVIALDERMQEGNEPAAVGTYADGKYVPPAPAFTGCERPNATLQAKLDGQLRRGATILMLTHDEIDEWRNQFDMVIPVHMLTYRGVKIIEIGDGVRLLDVRALDHASYPGVRDVRRHEGGRVMDANPITLANARLAVDDGVLRPGGSWRHCGCIGCTFCGEVLRLLAEKYPCQCPHGDVTERDHDTTCPARAS